MNQHVYEFLANNSLAVTAKRQLDRLEFGVWRWRQRWRAWERQFEPARLSHSYRWCIVTVKRTQYVDFAMQQINSLHYYNPYHVFDVLGDELCEEYFQQHRTTLDYPDRVRFVRLNTKNHQMWQQAKMQAVVYACEHDAILVDADMYWFADPLIRQWQALFFANAYLFQDEPAEKALLEKVFRHPEWAKFPHYTTGVLFVPYSLFSSELKKKLFELSEKQQAQTYNFLPSQADKDRLRRLTDEMAINLAIQSLIPAEQITTLKGTDTPGDRRLVLSIYYGSMHQVIS